MDNFAIPNDKREFRCGHCNGKILIPKDLPPTTGPCPHCSGVITSPALETLPAPAMPVPPAYQTPLPVVTQVIPTVPDTAPPPAPTVTETPSPAVTAPRVEKVVKAPVVIPPPREPAPAAQKSIARPTPAKSDADRKSSLIPVMLVLLALMAAAGVAMHFLAKEMGKNIAPPAGAKSIAEPAAKDANYIRIGWQKEAYQLLRNFIAASSSKAKLPYILNADALAGRVEDFYGGGVINDSDTPADAFSVYELSEEDRKRGLFMMIYDQPPQFDMKEFFRPLAPLEVQYGVEEADMLLTTMARVGNFAMEPLRVHAFFKRTPAGLKLDWEVFTQTKYRTLQSFVELPEVGQHGIFRVFIVEDVPDKGRLETGNRTYRIADPANIGDSARLNVKVDSEIGRALSIINWRGTKENRPNTRTATVELKWTGEKSTPELEISRFICWEFLGLGGEQGPTTVSK